jgi:hypothetical protein
MTEVKLFDIAGGNRTAIVRRCLHQRQAKNGTDPARSKRLGAGRIS